jgi:mono/diheme cytochrome c family protein
MKNIPVLCAVVLLIALAIPLAQGAQGDQFEQGKKLYAAKCTACHGADGKGTGPAASAFHPRPFNFTDPAFWKNNPDKKITDAVENGYELMPAIDLSTDQIKAVIAYIAQAFQPSGAVKGEGTQKPAP